MAKELEKLRAAWRRGEIPGIPGPPAPPDKDPDSEDSDDEEPEDAEEPERTTLTEAAKNNRLRRVCEEKPSGRCHVPQEIRDRWAKGGSERLALRDELEQCGWDKDYLKGICMHRSIYIISHHHMQIHTWATCGHATTHVRNIANDNHLGYVKGYGIRALIAEFAA